MKRLSVAIIAAILCSTLICASTSEKSDAVETVIVIVIIALAVFGLLRSFRRKKTDCGCGHCPVADTCKKPQNKRKKKES